MTPSKVLVISLVTIMVISAHVNDQFTTTVNQISSLSLQTASDVANGPFSESAFRVLAHSFLEVVQILKDFPVSHIQSKLSVLSSGLRDHQDFHLLDDDHPVASRQLQSTLATQGWVNSRLALYSLNTTVTSLFATVNT